MEHSQLRLTEERYDNLIAYPEGGLGYEDNVLSREQFAWTVKHHAAVMAHNLAILKKSMPTSLREMLVVSEADLCVVQLRKQFTWGDIGDLLDDMTLQYLREAYADTSTDEPGASMPSE